MANINYNNKRAQRIRRKLKQVNSERFRLTVFRSSRNVSAQIIDDKNNKTLVSASSIKEKNTNKKADLSILVAEELAKKAKEKKITKIFCISLYGVTQRFFNSFVWFCARDSSTGEVCCFLLKCVVVLPLLGMRVSILLVKGVKLMR